LLPGRLVTALNSPGQRNFFRRRQQFYLANLAEIKLQRIAVQ